MRHTRNFGATVTPSGNVALRLLAAAAATAIVGVAREDWTTGAAPESTPHLPADHQNYPALAVEVGGAVLLVAAARRARHAMTFLRGPTI